MRCNTYGPTVQKIQLHFRPSIHPLSVLLAVSVKGHSEAKPVPADHRCKRWCAPWEGCQSITWLTLRWKTIHTHIHTFGQFREASCMSFYMSFRKKRECLKETQAGTTRTCPRKTSSCCEVTVITTEPPGSPKSNCIWLYLIIHVIFHLHKHYKHHKSKKKIWNTLNVFCKFKSLPISHMLWTWSVLQRFFENHLWKTITMLLGFWTGSHSII